MSTRIRHDRRVDDYSRAVFERAAKLAKDPRLSVADRKKRLDEFARAKETQLRRDFNSGRIGRDQFDGGPTALDAGGGELAEIRGATELAKTLLGSPDAVKKLRQDPLLFTSDVFHNVTLTGTAEGGHSVHLRFGTHGGLENRAGSPNADGFPFPGTKWVEGDLVVGDRVYSFVDTYTDNFKVDKDDQGRPVALRFRGEVDVKRLAADPLRSGREKWSARKPPTASEGRALVEFTLPLHASGGGGAKYGAAGIGFEDRNFALASTGGKISIQPLGRPGPATALTLREGVGQLEAGQYKNVPRAMPAVYTFAQGQRIDTARVFGRALAAEPRAVLALLAPGSALHRDVSQVAAGGRAAADLAGRVDADIRARSQLDPELRRQAAPVIVRHLAGEILPAARSDRTTSTQFEGKLLADDFASRLISKAVGAALDEAGVLDANGVFTSYEGSKARDLFERNPDLVDPVAVLNVNHVPLYRDGAKDPALLERRTDLLFDTRAGAFAIGFQEVFHER